MFACTFDMCIKITTYLLTYLLKSSKCTKSIFDRGAATDPAGEANDAPHIP